MKHSLTKGTRDVGRNYSAQWRSYKGEAIAYNSDNNSFIYERHDQIKELIVTCAKTSRARLKVAPHGIQLTKQIRFLVSSTCHDN
jgi:thymidylate synthase